MPMKPKDASVATALIIQGYVRANGDDNKNLAAVIAAIRQECDDWAENLEDGADGSIITSMIETADAIAKDIDASERRPHTQLAMFHGICADLRSRGVDVENKVSCPANWM